MIEPEYTGTWLTPYEIAELTATKPNSYKAQCRKLAVMGIPFLPNAIGRPLVQRDVVLKTPAKKPASSWKGPNWDALERQSASGRARRSGSRDS